MRVLILSVLISLQVTFGYTSLLQRPLRCYATDTACVTALTQSLETNFLQEIPGISNARLDPVDVDYIKFERNGMTLEIKNTKMMGLKNWVLDELSPKTNVSMGRALFRADVIATGLYKIDGTLLFVPMKGTGDYSMTMNNMELEVLAPKVIIKNMDGVEYAEASDYTFNYDVKDDAQIRINDHYYGNTLFFNDVVNYLLSYNWKFVKSDYGKAFIDKIYDDISQTYKNYF